MIDLIFLGVMWCSLGYTMYQYGFACILWLFSRYGSCKATMSYAFGLSWCKKSLCAMSDLFMFCWHSHSCVVLPLISSAVLSCDISWYCLMCEGPPLHRPLRVSSNLSCLTGPPPTPWCAASWFLLVPASCWPFNLQKVCLLQPCAGLQVCLLPPFCPHSLVPALLLPHPGLLPWEVPVGMFGVCPLCPPALVKKPWAQAVP